LDCIVKTTICFCFICGTLSLSAMAQSAPTPSEKSVAAAPAPDALELTRLLQDFLAGASRNDVAMHDRFWADDLIYTGSAGKRIGKGDIMRDVRSEVSSPPKANGNTIYTAEDIRIQQYGTTAIVAFRLVATTTKDGKSEATNYLNSGTFLKRGNKWQAVNWQATKVPPPEQKP
jgi:ketosteroid isomerase-like protein